MEQLGYRKLSKDTIKKKKRNSIELVSVFSFPRIYQKSCTDVIRRNKKRKVITLHVKFFSWKKLLCGTRTRQKFRKILIPFPEKHGGQASITRPLTTRFTVPKTRILRTDNPRRRWETRRANMVTQNPGIHGTKMSTNSFTPSMCSGGTKGAGTFTPAN